ncbi:MAG: hypothetical protein V7L11_14935 [Nostoc sp.]|uniref:hypothetical protein n=1 Tax=Nostoc sp. TaxID=1180 RepID=UPI002FF5CA8A
MKITPPNNALINKADVRGNFVAVYIIYPQIDEVNPSITEEKLKTCIVAIYVTGLGIGDWGLGIGQ